MASGKIEVICPCCETKLKVDKKTGEVIWEEKKVKGSETKKRKGEQRDKGRKDGNGRGNNGRARR